MYNRIQTNVPKVLHVWHYVSFQLGSEKLPAITLVRPVALFPVDDSYPAEGLRGWPEMIQFSC